MFEKFLSIFSDCSSFGSSDRLGGASYDLSPIASSFDSPPTFAEPSPFNSYGTAACDIQSASEASSITASSCTTDTWGSINSGTFGSGTDPWG